MATQWKKNASASAAQPLADAGPNVVPIKRTRKAVAPAASAPGSLQATLSAGLAYELGIDSFFGASHAMRPNGERHTHSFRVQASFVTESVDENGMICGFREVSDLLDEQAKRFVNRFLNEMEPFAVLQPTGENLASVIYRDLATALVDRLDDPPKLVSVTLWENPTSYVRISPKEAA